MGKEDRLREQSKKDGQEQPLQVRLFDMLGSHQPLQLPRQLPVRTAKELEKPASLLRATFNPHVQQALQTLSAGNAPLPFILEFVCLMYSATTAFFARFPGIETMQSTVH